MKEKEQSYLLNNFSSNNYFKEPFVHFLFDEFFDQNYYEELLINKPEDKLFSSSDPNRTTNQYSLNYRRRFSFINDMNLLSDIKRNFWEKFIKFMTSKEFAFSFLNYCKDPIFDRFKITNLNDLKLNIRMELIRDTGGYMIAPHTDSPSKIITFLIYLPENNENIEMGTSLYVPKNSDFRSDKATQYDFHLFKEVKKMPFKRNFAFGFVKNDRSFHGRPQINKEFKGHRDWINYSLRIS